MEIRLKPIIVLASGALFLSNFSTPSANAQSTLIEAGSSVLSDSVLTATGPEALTVSWFVVENTVSDVYTYAYNVNNPVGDVELNNDGSPTSIPENFNNFSITFDTTVPGAYVSGTAPVNGSLANLGTGGLTWTFPAVSPGTSSALLAFQSDLAPTMYNAAVSGGGSPPGPWHSVPGGQEVPVPKLIPEPGITSLFTLTAILLLPFSPTWRRLVQKSWDSAD
jgi:hypothetical protein